MIALGQVKSFIDCAAVYFSVQLGRCAVFSVPILGVVLLFRKTVLKNSIFLKGAAWGLFLVVPFLGKLRLYYENEFARRLLLWWQDLCIGSACVRYGYFLGILLAAIWLVRKHWRMRKMLAAMPMESVNGQRVYICGAPMSPFTTGLFKHKIVIPKVVREQMSDREVATIQLHENVHIRLGHLWVFFLWDLLCTLIWCNPLLRYSSRYLKDDMEHICDKVTIQKDGRDNISYGKLIIKSMALLSVESASLAAFSGENDYAAAKERMNRIRDYRPYRKAITLLLCAACAVFIIGLFLFVNYRSYPAYTPDEVVALRDMQGNMAVLPLDDLLKQAIWIDDQRIINIDKNRFENILQQNGIDTQECYLLIGSCSKLPGIGGPGCDGTTVYIDCNMDDDIISAPLNSERKGILAQIYKRL